MAAGILLGADLNLRSQVSTATSRTAPFENRRVRHPQKKSQSSAKSPPKGRRLFQIWFPALTAWANLCSRLRRSRRGDGSVSELLERSNKSAGRMPAVRKAKKERKTVLLGSCAQRLRAELICVTPTALETRRCLIGASERMFFACWI